MRFVKNYCTHSRRFAVIRGDSRRFVAIRGDSWRFAAICGDLLISDTRFKLVPAQDLFPRLH